MMFLALSFCPQKWKPLSQSWISTGTGTAWSTSMPSAALTPSRTGLHALSYKCDALEMLFSFLNPFSLEPNRPADPNVWCQHQLFQVLTELRHQACHFSLVNKKRNASMKLYTTKRKLSSPFATPPTSNFRMPWCNGNFNMTHVAQKPSVCSRLRGHYLIKQGTWHSLMVLCWR